MDILSLFKQYLFSQKKKPSAVTVKNYTADIRHFIAWFENQYNVPFNPTLITPDHCKQFTYAKGLSLSKTSLERHESSLRKFFAFLLATKAVTYNPFDLKSINHIQKPDPWNIDFFKAVLQKEGASTVTIKNYVTDIKQFLSWVGKYKKEETTAEEISTLFNTYFVEQYKEYLLRQQWFSQSSIKRKVSSIRKYMLWINPQQGKGLRSSTVSSGQPNCSDELLKDEESLQNQVPDDTEQSNIATNYPLENLPLSADAFPTITDLPDQVEPRETITNTVDDPVPGYVFGPIRVIILPKEVINVIARSEVPTTKQSRKGQAPIAANGIRNDETQPKTYRFLQIDYQKYFHNKKNKLYQQLINKTAKKTPYSKIPPIRLVQKLYKGCNLLLDFGIVLPLAKAISYSDYLLWVTKGKPVFGKSGRLDLIKSDTVVYRTKQGSKLYNLYNYYKNYILFPTRIRISIDGSQLTLHHLKQIIPPHIRHKILHHRPAWYHKYHSYAITHYFHSAVLIIFMSAVGFNFYADFFGAGNSRPVFASLPTAPPPKLIAFQGKLTDSNNNPIVGRTNVRFSVYNSHVASGSALLWQELDNILPDKNGNVSVSLGEKSYLSPDMFTRGSSLWLGVTVENHDELRPRQQLPTTALAANAQTLAGMPSITDPDAGTNNVVLALDSAGNLSIGGNADHTFQVTGGQFTLSGNILLLSTTPGSNGDVQLAPDGLGMIDIQKPIHNTSNYGNIPSALGSVEVDDTFAILATASGQSALTINQNAYGPLISASSGGIAKFTVDNDGSITTAGNLSVKGNVASNLIPFGNTQNLGSFNAQWNNVFAKKVYVDGHLLSSPWQESNDAIFPVDQTKNLEVGLGASTSANFTIVASTGAILTNGSIGTSNNQTLTIGNPTTGAVAISPNNTAGIFVNGSGNVNIGTQNIAETSALHIQKNTVANPLVIADQQGTGSIFMGLANGLTKFSVDNNGDTRIIGGGLCLSSSNTCSGKSLTAGTLYASNTTVQSADLAENYISSQQLESGDIVIPEDLGNNMAVVKSTGSYQSQVIGVISTKPGVTLNSDAAPDDKHPNVYPIALSGRVPVKVSTENGIVRTGDLLTSSTVPGVAMKATEAGPIIGKALENFSSQTPAKIMAYISISWANPNVYLTDVGNLNSSDFALSNLNTDQQSTLVKLASSISNGTQISLDNLYSDMLTAKSAKIDGLTVNTKITANIANIDKVYSNMISANSDTGKIALTITDDKIEVHSDRSASSSAVLSIDTSGNATFSGTIKSDGLVINNNAKINGTLYAGKIVADEIVGMVNATPSAQYITNIYNVIANNAQTPSPTGIDSLSRGVMHYTPTTDINDVSSESARINHTSDSGALADIASYSGYLSYVPALQLHTNAETFQQGLVSLGPTSLADTAIDGQLSIGTSFVLADNSINVLGGDLELQPLRQGGVSIAGRQVYIDSSGNVSIQGNETVNGTLAANVISPVANHDLVVKLDNGNTNGQDANLSVNNKSNTPVFTVNQIGDIIASGAATVSKINLNVVEPAIAVSNNEVIESGSAGIATISAHETFVTIDNKLVTDKSLIYITPVGQNDLSPFLLRQAPDKSFTVGVQLPAYAPIQFNWLIIN